MKTVSRLAPQRAISYKPRAFSAAVLPANARVAQLVEQRIENPRVTGSIPVPGTNLFNDLEDFGFSVSLCLASTKWRELAGLNAQLWFDEGGRSEGAGRTESIW